MRRVIVIAGEALVDLVPGGDDVLDVRLGGGPFNVARAVARLGGGVAYLGRLSEDRFGRALHAALVEDGVDDGLAVTTADPTTLAVAEVDAAGAAKYAFYMDGTSVPGLAAAPDVSSAEVLCVGSLGLLFEPTARTLEGLVAAAPADQLVACDPNIRPPAIRDEPSYRARLARVLAGTDVLKASEEDLAWLAPGVPLADAARALLGERAGVALVTLGGDGALIVPADPARETVTVPAPPVDVVDTIGAGDAFLGGFLAWWQARGLGRADLADDAAVLAATSEASAVAARVCTVAGASLPR